MVAALSVCKNAKAQYVTIPDANFAWFLNNNYPLIMVNGNQLDTTQIVQNYGWAINLNCSSMSISDLTGIQYFLLASLDCSNNSLTSLPPLLKNPYLGGFANLVLNCSNNQLTSLNISNNSFQTGKFGQTDHLFSVQTDHQKLWLKLM